MNRQEETLTYTVSIVISAVVTPSALQAFMRTVPDATVLDEPVYVARVSRATQHVWVGLSDTYLEDVGDDEVERLRQVLGAEPHSVLMLDISWENNADKLGVQVTSLLLERWPGVVVDGSDNLYTADQLHAMRAANQGFWDNPYHSIRVEQ